MKKITSIIVLLSFKSICFANTLNSTQLSSLEQPTKSKVEFTTKVLKNAIETESKIDYKVLLDLARKALKPNKVMKTFKAAIVVSKNGKKVNLADYEDFLESNDGLCYNGNIDLAFEVANKINDKESIWIYDEYLLDSIEINGKSINFNVMDEFSFSDQDASEDDRDDFITTYTASKC
jgi:hypothetical protein